MRARPARRPGRPAGPAPPQSLSAAWGPQLERLDLRGHDVLSEKQLAELEAEVVGEVRVGRWLEPRDPMFVGRSRVELWL